MIQTTIPTFDDNESCQFDLKDEPDQLVMVPEEEWKEFRLGQLFDVPGMDENVTAMFYPIKLVGTCEC